MEKQYCRHCGENKGHSTSSCKNTAAIKRTLALVDAELDGTIREKNRLREEVVRLLLLQGGVHHA